MMPRLALGSITRIGWRNLWRNRRRTILALTAIGLALGLVLAVGMTQFIAGQLYGIGATDPATILGVVALLAAISLLACYLPARRAMHADPIAAIRQQ